MINLEEIERTFSHLVSTIKMTFTDESQHLSKYKAEQLEAALDDLLAFRNIVEVKVLYPNDINSPSVPVEYDTAQTSLLTEIEVLKSLVIKTDILHDKYASQWVSYLEDIQSAYYKQCYVHCPSAPFNFIKQRAVEAEVAKAASLKELERCDRAINRWLDLKTAELNTVEIKLIESQSNLQALTARSDAIKLELDQSLKLVKNLVNCLVDVYLHWVEECALVDEGNVLYKDIENLKRLIHLEAEKITRLEAELPVIADSKKSIEGTVLLQQQKAKAIDQELEAYRLSQSKEFKGLFPLVDGNIGNLICQKQTLHNKIKNFDSALKANAAFLEAKTEAWLLSIRESLAGKIVHCLRFLKLSAELTKQACARVMHKYGELSDLALSQKAKRVTPRILATSSGEYSSPALSFFSPRTGAASDASTVTLPSPTEFTLPSASASQPASPYILV